MAGSSECGCLNTDESAWRTASLEFLEALKCGGVDGEVGAGRTGPSTGPRASQDDAEAGLLPWEGE